MHFAYSEGVVKDAIPGVRLGRKRAQRGRKAAGATPETGQAMQALNVDGVVPLESVLCTDELSRRPSRPPDYERENRALVALSQALADSPLTVLQKLAETILETFHAGSAGVSLLTKEDGGKHFYWPAIAGVWKPHIGGGTPRDFGPCGDVLDRNSPLLFRHLERRYTYFLPVTPAVAECLLVPFNVEGKAVGTIWAISHDDRRKFDNEDLRQLLSLGRFASSAYQAQAALETLQGSEIRYRRLFQAAKDGILILDAKTGKIIDANAFMCGLLGQELVELMGKELYEIGMFEDEAANKAAFEELQQNGYIRYDHLPVMKPNGTTTQVEFVSNVYREDHRLVAQCNVRDISVRIQMEQQVKQQAEAMADQHRRKDEFLAMLSHELRNPLAPIRSATHLLRLQERGSENLIQRQAREVIERQVTQLTRLVSDLLEVSRVATGRIRLHLERLDMRQIVQDSLAAVGPLIEQRRHATVLTLPAEPVWVLADAARLEQVIVNLLNNAAKFTDECGRIEVSLEHGSNDALLRVRDSGRGIAPELLPRIFDLFTQADPSLDRSQGGLGIGLNLVQRLVELHGGTVEAHSPGLRRGSEFVVRLATVPAPGTPDAVTPARREERAAPGLRVLLVEDNVDACSMLASLLKHNGYGVQVEHTGPAGLRAALAWRPDVVLLDIGLPEIDGYEVARRLHHDPAMKNTRLVALTGYGAASDLQLAREAGFDAHMLKPVDFGELEKLLAAWHESRS
jgi:PAS domain S-box-containing protein